MINANIFTIDQITSNATTYIQEEIDKLHNIEVKMSIGSITGLNYLSGAGPKVASAGKISTDLRSEFISKGINQTLHRIYLQIDCKMNVLLPFETLEENISNQILIAENVIIGQIPNTYYNLEGIEQPEALINTNE